MKFAQTLQHPRADVSVPPPQTTRERYAAVKQIGRGTFADVWEVRSTDVDGRFFALKALRKGKCLVDGKLDASKCARYGKAIVAEGKRIARLNALDRKGRAQIVRCREILLPRNVSPNLAAAVTGANGSNPIGPCVVMELLGVSLTHFQKMRKRKGMFISLRTVRFIALQLFNAMSFLHGVGRYIHADLKPENVVLSLEHSVGGDDRVLNNEHPNIKIVDFGNTIGIGRTVRTFEVQSLFYRAPEIIFGNEMTAAIDLWSIGCILLELTSAHEYCRGLEAIKQAQIARFNQKGDATTAFCHRAVFASSNNAQLATQITTVLTSFPAYFYNKFDSLQWAKVSANPNLLTHDDVDYSALRCARQQRLVDRMQLDSTTSFELHGDDEFCEFLDLIAGLLDPNPATRLTSEDATQHPFCIDIDYVRDDQRLHKLLRTRFDSAFPIISISNDADRQRRLNAQMQRYRTQCDAADAVAARPSPTAITRITSHGDERCSDPTVRHSRAICLVKGCCGNPTVLRTSRRS